MKKYDRLPVVWKPQDGSQLIFVDCPIQEVLFAGTRGGCGKTDALLFTYLRFVNKGYGANWRGIIFRHSYPQLRDIINKSQRWIPKIFPKAKYNKSRHIWVFPESEELIFNYITNEKDLAAYQGHEYPFIGFEELTNWRDNTCYEGMKICNRSADPNVPRFMRATCNPLGKGHSWVKDYFIDAAPPEVVFTSQQGLQRCWIKGDVLENKILLKADPTYIQKLQSIPDPNKRAAWLEGRWDIVAGGAFSDAWEQFTHVIKSFDIPKQWYIDRSFDWGFSRPFSVGYWAESDGVTPAIIDGKYKYYPKGTLFRIAEYYGCTGVPNQGMRLTPRQIADNIITFEKQHLSNYTINEGDADPSIFEESRGKSIAGQMGNEYVTMTIHGRTIQKFIQGITFNRGNNKPGSRASGFNLLYQLFTAAKAVPQELPGLFVFDNCRDFIRTVPNLPLDEKKLDDVDTTAEDHIYDETRYSVLSERRQTFFGSLMG